jgi:hypothetical protein
MLSIWQVLLLHMQQQPPSWTTGPHLYADSKPTRNKAFTALPAHVAEQGFRLLSLHLPLLQAGRSCSVSVWNAQSASTIRTSEPRNRDVT